VFLPVHQRESDISIICHYYYSRYECAAAQVSRHDPEHQIAPTGVQTPGVARLLVPVQTDLKPQPPVKLAPGLFPGSKAAGA
jgi:hypothetical protein